ncbi:MAG: hypothetical protein H6Q14_385 [Bacteroidetes bacterium]|nr:hypothetical protein [Bacteroidota bacterium]MBP1616558.1 hypothetical protein [Bacteroidota bacterium]
MKANENQLVEICYEYKTNIYIHKDITDLNRKLWRYMDLPKFLSFRQGTLYFSNKLDLSDERERGIFYVQKSDKKQLSPFVFGFMPVCDKEADKEFYDANMESQRNIDKAYKAYVNCWNQSEDESYALWNIYLKTRVGVAVQTTLQKLIDSIHKPENPIFISPVQYSLKDKRAGCAYEAIFTKRNYYDFEQELRMAIIAESSCNRQKVDITSDILIESILISPLLLKWEQEELYSLLKQFYEKNDIVRYSSIADSK